MEAQVKPHHTLIDKFVALLGICHRMNSERDFDELLELIAKEAAKLADAERATIFLLDREKAELWAKVALGTSEIIRFDARLGIAGAVTKTGKTMTVEDVYKSPLFYPAVDALTGYHTRNILSVPLRNFRREVIGVFQVLNKKSGRFLPEDEQFVEALASQAAVALENARMLVDLEEKKRELIEENQTLRREVEERFSVKNILGATQKMQEIRTLIERISETSMSVLITGENGTGKELAAKAIHYGSPRAKKPFVALNCAAVPETLVESELFGIERGVATGVERRAGRIESANGGTLFLDEIGDLSLSAQAKLLRVLQEREIEWVGGRKPVSVDVRVIAATNKDLKTEIENGRFRQDLYFRLNVIHLNMPPLRSIRGDIPLLATHFMRKYGQEIERKIEGFSTEAVKALTVYNWPGNVRELENEVKRALVLSTGGRIELEDLSEAIREGTSIAPAAPQDTSASSSQSLKDRVSNLEIQMIREVLTRTNGDRKKTARILGLSHQGLINKIKRYGLEN